MTLLAILFAVAYVILLLYYLTGWIKLKTFDIESKTPEQKFSIIIPARNEETNIQYLISDLFKQNYPNDLFEILIVDDHSEDYTAETVDKFLQQEEFSNLRLLQLRDQPSSGHGKKAAITYAVEKSINDWIICTDADCRLNSNWLSSLAAFIDEKDPVFVSAVVVFHEERTFFEKMQSLEFMSLIGIGAATISHGKPTMCNGANMAFRRDVFLEVNGYAGNEHIASGDDEFLMHKMAAKYPGGVSFLKSEVALVRTQARTTFKSFWNQRKRWISKSKGYKNPFERGMQVFVWLFHLSLLLTLIIAFFNPVFWSKFLLLFAIKLFAELLFIIPLSGFFNKQNLIFYYFPAAFLYIFYVVFIAFAGSFGKNYWKGRRI